MIQESSQSNKKIKEFTDLFAWQEAHKLVIQIYKLSQTFPSFEQYGLANQMRRAAVSITSNIAEGFGRRGNKEKLQFFFMAQGSLTEIKNQLFICRDIGYCSTETFSSIWQQIAISHKLLQGLISKTKTLS